MHSPPFPDLSVQLTRRRSRCVLDPNLALSRDGAMLVRCLVPYAELWIGPEIHNILDSVQLYQREPQLLVLPGADKGAIAEIPEALRDWTRLRDATGRGLYWVGDAYRESSMPEDIDDRFVLRWELASRALDLCLPKNSRRRDHGSRRCAMQRRFVQFCPRAGSSVTAPTAKRRCSAAICSSGGWPARSCPRRTRWYPSNARAFSGS